MKSFDNKVVVITGGNSGIGKAIAKSFYVQGAKVVISGRDQSKLESGVEEFLGTSQRFKEMLVSFQIWISFIKQSMIFMAR
jgi:NADP-dependent 3-hydroxy acid dehydrogenase YdfG